MKKTIAISFLLVFLFANTELHQLLKLPLLIHHYLEHQHHDHDENIISFIDDHYNGLADHHSHDSDHSHDNLPFKSNDCATTHSSVAMLDQCAYPIANLKIAENTLSPMYKSLCYSSAIINTIWQPPKMS